jgi:hypothetical protein
MLLELVAGTKRSRDHFIRFGRIIANFVMAFISDITGKRTYWIGRSGNVEDERFWFPYMPNESIDAVFSMKGNDIMIEGNFTCRNMILRGNGMVTILGDELMCNKFVFDIK